MSSEKRYLNDSLLLQFQDVLETASTWDGKLSVVLRGTAFYPQSGGQLGDRGQLTCEGETRHVLDTQIDPNGLIHHIVESPFPQDFAGKTVEGNIHKDRRRDMMSQHTGQHLLSAAFFKVAGLDTASARLGAEISTIDLPIKDLKDQHVVEAEAMVNRIVLENRAIGPLYPNSEELEKMALRRTPKVTANIRIMEVKGFDLTPCGGTHCSQTGQVGAVKIVSRERYKGLTRVGFVAGERALNWLNKRDAVLGDVCRTLGCGADDLSDVIAKWRSDLKEQGQTLGKVRAELIGFLCKEALKEWKPDVPILMIRENDDLATIRRLAGKLAQEPKALVLAACRNPDGQWSVVVERGSEVNLHVGNWFREQSQKLGGRGGGRPERAEGRWPKADWNAMVAQLQSACS